MILNPGDLVTIKLPKNNNASNTFVVELDEGTTVLVTHPLSPVSFFRLFKKDLNLTSANLKDSTERSIDFANNNKSYLDYNTICDLEALSMYFTYKRSLTPRLKYILANICGTIANIKFNNDLQIAIDFILKNQGLLDQFNAMWFNNFRGLFSGRQAVTSKKQRSAIFNIAGFLLAELETPSASK